MADLMVTNEGEGLICQLISGKVAPESLRLALFGTTLTIGAGTTLANCTAAQIACDTPSTGYLTIAAAEWDVQVTAGDAAGGATLKANAVKVFSWNGASSVVKGIFLYHNSASKLLAAGNLDTTYQSGSGGGTLSISIDGLRFTNV